MLQTFCRYRELSSIGTLAGPRPVGRGLRACGTPRNDLGAGRRERQGPGRDPSRTIRHGSGARSRALAPRSSPHGPVQGGRVVRDDRRRRLSTRGADRVRRVAARRAAERGRYRAPPFGPPIESISIQPRPGHEHRTLTYEFESVPSSGPEWWVRERCFGARGASSPPATCPTVPLFACGGCWWRLARAAPRRQARFGRCLIPWPTRASDVLARARTRAPTRSGCARRRLAARQHGPSLSMGTSRSSSRSSEKAARAGEGSTVSSDVEAFFRLLAGLPQTPPTDQVVGVGDNARGVAERGRRRPDGRSGQSQVPNGPKSASSPNRRRRPSPSERCPASRRGPRKPAWRR